MHSKDEPWLEAARDFKQYVEALCRMVYALGNGGARRELPEIMLSGGVRASTEIRQKL